MKAKNVITGILLISIVLLAVGHERGWAKEKKEILPAKIAVVNISRIILADEETVQWQEKITAEEQRIKTNIESLLKDTKGIDADMATRKPGSSDFLELLRKGMEKEALAQYYQRELAVKQRQWEQELNTRRGQLTRKITVAIENVAKERGLDIVMAKEDVPQLSLVLYCSEDIDITDDVLAALNGAK